MHESSAASKVVIVVSGLPRSGTSLMMKMLEAAGVSVLTDNVRQADSDNPGGYYEFERVKRLDKGDLAWLDQAQGKAVKVISALLEHLPPGYSYKVLFMQRRVDEILSSQRRMLLNRQQETALNVEAADATSDARLAEIFEKHLRRVKAWLSAQPNVSVLDVNYNMLLANPGPQLVQINQFLEADLDTEKMASAIDPNLYRNRGNHPRIA